MEKNMSKLGNVPHRYARYAEIMFYEDAEPDLYLQDAVQIRLI